MIGLWDAANGDMSSCSVAVAQTHTDTPTHPIVSSRVVVSDRQLSAQTATLLQRCLVHRIRVLAGRLAHGIPIEELQLGGGRGHGVL